MRAFFTTVITLLLISGCVNHASQSGSATSTLPAISPGSSENEIADLLVSADDARVATPALAALFPALDRQTAYAIQLETLVRRQDEGARIVGWKLGGTRVTDHDARPDPLFGYSLDRHVFTTATPLPADSFVGGAPEVEAEITLHIGADLPGPTVSREELIAAISGVSGSVEVLSKRLSPSPADEPTSLTPEHAVADNLSHGGVILGSIMIPVDEFDFNAETAVMRINGEEAASGSGADIMGSHGTALDAVLWLANELPRHGLHLKTGDYVVTGSMYANPSVQAGDTAELAFSTLGTISFAVR